MLLDEIKKMKEELAKSEEVKDEVEEQVEEIPEEKPEEKPEEPKEEIKEEKPKEEKLDDAGYARLRREAAAEKKRAEKLEQELAELRKPKEVENPEPVTPLAPEVQAMVADHQINRAREEFAIYESKVKQLHPEYGAIASEYAAALYQSIRLQNPRKSEVELNKMTERAILIKAGEYAKAGYENPVEEMFHEAKELGFTGKSLKKEELKEEVLEPDMKKVAENRKRSAGMAASNGRQEGLITATAAAALTAAEWSKLSKADKQRLMYGR